MDSFHEIVNKINSEYDLPSPALSITKIELESMNPNYVINAADKRYFLKNYRTDIIGAVDRIKEIHVIENYFKLNGVKVITPYLNKISDSVFIYKNEFYTLYPFIEAHTVDDPDLLSVTNIKSLGETLAKIHLIGYGKTTLSSWTYKVLNLQNFNDRYLQLKSVIESKPNPDDFDKLALHQLNLKNRYVKSLNVKVDPILINDHLIHGDFHERNVFFDDHGIISHIFDLEKSAIYPRSIELARSLDITCISGSSAIKQDLTYAKEYLYSYSKTYPLEAKEFVAGFVTQIQHRLSSLWGFSEYYLANKNFGKKIILSESTKLEWYVNDLILIVKDLVSVL